MQRDLFLFMFCTSQLHSMLVQGLEVATGLKLLALSFNELSSMEGLGSLTRLTCLDLSFNAISCIQSLKVLHPYRLLHSHAMIVSATSREWTMAKLHSESTAHMCYPCVLHTNTPCTRASSTQVPSAHHLPCHLIAVYVAEALVCRALKCLQML